MNPPEAYSEVLEKSIGGLRKRKEVFELSALTGSQGWPSLAAGQRFESRPGTTAFAVNQNKPTLTMTKILLLLILFSITSSALASEQVPIAKVASNSESYNLHVVTLQGTIRAVRALEPYCYLKRSALCCGAYTFILEDETGSIEVGVSGICTGFFMEKKAPEVSDGDKVIIDAQIYAPGHPVGGDLPSGNPRDTPFAVVMRIQSVSH